MESLEQRLAKLSPDQRAALEAKLAQRNKDSVPRFQIPHHDMEADGVLSFAQERFWFLDKLIFPSNAFNTGFALRIKGEFDENAIANAFEQLLLRHASLRTTFPTAADGRPVAAALPEDRLPSLVVETIDRRSADSLPEAVSAFLGQPFDLAAGPLIRARIFTENNGDWILAIGMHHIIADAHSLGLVLKDVERLYARRKSATPTAIEAPQLEYADFSAWQRSPTSLELQSRDLEYWTRRLRDAPPILELPLDHPRPPEQSYRGNQLFRELPKDLGKRIRELSDQTEATPFMILLAAFKILLFRTTGKKDIVVGTPSAHWPDERLHEVVGPFINMLPLRTQIREESSFMEFLVSLKDGFLESLEHQGAPFERIVESLNPKRDMGVSPFFQVAFMYQNLGDTAVSFDNCDTELLRLPSRSAKYDITLMVLNNGDDQLEFAIEYATDLFNESTILRFLERMQYVTELFTQNLGTKIREISIIPKREEEKLLSLGRGPLRSFPENESVLSFVERFARAHPSRPAIVERNGEATYEYIEKRANAIAIRLQTEGVGPNTRVGVCLERSLELVPALLAIMRIGATYIPLDPMFPADRLAFMLEDSQASILLHDESAPPSLLKKVPARIDLNGQENRFSEWEEATLPKVDHSDQVAYIIYTSGSTGKPKGVAVTHKALMNFLWSMREEPGFEENDRLLALTTISFDISGLELFLPLACGGSLFLARMEDAVDGRRLIDIIQSQNVRVLQATPTTFRLMLAFGWKGDSKMKLLCGGEALPKDLARDLLPRCGALWNMYGPTETTIWSTCSRILSAEDIHIGTPIGNTKTYVVDDQFRLSPMGSIGELVIGGVGVANGYINRQEITEQKFRSSPFSSGERIYVTGDLARYRDDGNIECIGRKDSQIKLRGYRIELEEIESCLATHPEIGQAAVAVTKNGQGIQGLSAFYTPKNGEQIPHNVLKDFLRKQLPEYMVPAYFHKMELLPLTSSGKLDRKALRQPITTEPSNQPRFEKPKGPVEKKLAKLVAETLDLDRVGRNESFFDIGGHSILAATLFRKIEQEFGTRLPLATLFKSPTTAALAEVLGSWNSSSTGWRSLVTIREGGSGIPLFLIHGAGGNILLYRDLAKRLKPGFPIYGLQSLGLDGKTPPITSIEEMASHYLSEIRALQVRGPYQIGGYCMGGKVAFEIARLLELQGEEARFVALLDSYNFNAPNHPEIKSSYWSYYRQLIRFHMDNISSLDTRDIPSYLKEKSRMAVEAVREKLKIAVRKLSPHHKVAGSDIHLQKVNDQAGQLYFPKPYRGTVTLFKPKRNYKAFVDPKMGWGEVSKGGLKIETLDVNPHAMLVEPYVGELANSLNKVL